MDPTSPSTNEVDIGDGGSVAYSTFTPRGKTCIISLVAFVGWFSSVSSFIYFPTITALAESLSTTTSRINLTVTVYLAVAAIAPAIVGDLADTSGRRPVILIMLVIYTAANIGLATQKSYAALMILRMLQSAGISGVVAIAYGVVADIASPKDRGGYVGILSFGMNTAPAIGPLLGALLLQYLGWRSVFWFLSIASGLCLAIAIFILPETARNIAGNGSQLPSPIYRLPFPDIYSRSKYQNESQKTKLRFPNPFACLLLLRRIDTSITIVGFAVFYMVYTCLQTSLSSLFIQIYHLNQLQGGLIYLPFGIGCALAAFFTGRVLDRDYRKVAKQNGVELETLCVAELEPFPIVHARLRSVFITIFIATAGVVGYGWCLHSRTHISIPLTLQFIIGFAIQSCFTVLSTLLIDLNNDVPSTAAASSNLIRCTMAGIGTAVLEPLIERIGVGWCFSVLAIYCALLVPLLMVMLHRETRRVYKRDGSTRIQSSEPEVAREKN